MTRKITLTLTVLIFAGIALFFFGPFTSSDAGVITVELRDQNTLVRSVEASFDEGETLFDVLDRHFDVVCATPFYTPSETCDNNPLIGRAILGIDGLTTDWSGTFFQIRHNGTHSQLGVDRITFDDGDTITFDRIDVQSSP